MLLHVAYPFRRHILAVFNSLYVCESLRRVCLDIDVVFLDLVLSGHKAPCQQTRPTFRNNFWRRRRQTVTICGCHVARRGRYFVNISYVSISNHNKATFLSTSIPVRRLSTTKEWRKMTKGCERLFASENNLPKLFWGSNDFWTCWTVKQAGDEDMICGERQCDVASKVVSKSWPCFVDKGPFRG